MNLDWHTKCIYETRWQSLSVCLFVRERISLTWLDRHALFPIECRSYRYDQIEFFSNASHILFLNSFQVFLVVITFSFLSPPVKKIVWLSTKIDECSALLVIWKMWKFWTIENNWKDEHDDYQKFHCIFRALINSHFKPKEVLSFVYDYFDGLNKMLCFINIHFIDSFSHPRTSIKIKSCFQQSVYMKF
jgi:hypothetical protein